MSADLDVIVIGAGVAGLAALSDLQRAGKQAICLEARDRIGGRILTIRDPFCPIPLELGAEFIHGRPPEIWDLVHRYTLKVYNCQEHSLHLKQGSIEDRSDAWLLIDDILDQMKAAAATGPDRTFDDFLPTANAPENAKGWARNYVEGFNAAYANSISIQALAHESNASQSIDGDQASRIADGYDSIPLALARGLTGIRLNMVVEGVIWKPGTVAVHAVSAITGETQTFEAAQVVITIPLGDLQTKGITFDPVPDDAISAARQLCYGQVVRIVFRLRRPIWEHNPEFGDAGFLLSHGPVFPTWWTSLPMATPVLVGWSAGPKADALAACEPAQVIARAITQLADMTAIAKDRVQSELEQVYYHDWARDPFARGAYSYVPAGANTAREQLSQPVSNTLFFAGEATETNGHAATVHGAISSGRRAARQILGN